MTRTFVAVLVALATALTATAAFPQSKFEITPAMQAELDRQKTMIAGWAASPTIVTAVTEQNKRGPIAGMDNPKWKQTRRSDATVVAFQSNPAGQFLKSKVEDTKGSVSEAFLSGSHGEKVAFVEKTTSYIHVGQAKFDVPFTTGKAWQGQPEFDESSQTYAVQISVPVLAEGKPIGALVVGVNLTHLQGLAKK
jgi:hypothetical protein